jgi:hypothetical protein
MRNLIASTILAIVSLAPAGQAFAWNQAIRANVPFAFTAGNKELPSGTYTISPESSNVIKVQNMDQSIRLFLTTAPSPDGLIKGSKLVFRKYGDQYFLSEVLNSSSTLNVQLPLSKAEKSARYQEPRASGEKPLFLSVK